MRMTREQEDKVMAIIGGMVDKPDMEREYNMTQQQRQHREDRRVWARVMCCDV